MSPARVAHALGARRLLLVLDSCEHVITAAAAMAEAVLQAGAAARIIATSREPLRAEGERIYLVPPLGVPEGEVADGDVGELARYGAVRLFLERARVNGAQIVADRQVTAAIAAICRRLDGTPLAIELAAARTRALGLDNLVAGLDNRFSLLTSGRRTAVPRHQTLRATLDWSYELLPDAEKCLLRGLGVFAGGFALDAALTVMRGTDAASAVVEGISNLVGKSLVTFDGAADAGRWRLLETIRAYARVKLAECGETEPAARRHATFFRDLFAPAAEDPSLPIGADAVARAALEIDNVRAALDWAFSADGDEVIGAVPAAAYSPVWLRRGRIAECRARTERAAANLDGAAQLSAPLAMLHRGPRDGGSPGGQAAARRDGGGLRVKAAINAFLTERRYCSDGSASCRASDC